MRGYRVTILVVLLFVAVVLIIAGRALFCVRRNRLQLEARRREAEFLRENSPRRPL
jgi:hypothetical protein